MAHSGVSALVLPALLVVILGITAGMILFLNSSLNAIFLKT